jgi:hypothetical protein
MLARLAPYGTRWWADGFRLAGRIRRTTHPNLSTFARMG